jgi:hypothetical protein
MRPTSRLLRLPLRSLGDMVGAGRFAGQARPTRQALHACARWCCYLPVRKQSGLSHRTPQSASTQGWHALLDKDPRERRSLG